MRNTLTSNFITR